MATPAPTVQEPLRAPFTAVAAAVQRAWYDGRPIIPIVGAGLSHDSGFPVLTSVVRYFGKLQQYVARRAYLPPPEDIADPLAGLVDQYRNEPWQFVEDFGWPDRFQLNQDLLPLFPRRESGPRQEPSSAVEQSIREGLEAVLPHINPHAWRQFRSLETAVLGTGGVLDPEYALSGTPRRIDGLDLRLSERLTPRLSQESDPVARNVLAALSQVLSERFRRYWSDSVPFDLVGDWKRLIQYFTGHRGDLADALFATFGDGRVPSQGHRFLAFLVRLLGVRTVFTFNFDSLIEQALEAEGSRPEVFAMEEGAALPHHTLIRDAVAVIKLHGGNHSLLLDDRLDRPLDPEYKRRFGRIVRERPLLLVVGCSGNDYRLRDLVLHVLRQAARGPGPDVVWLYYEQEPPSFISDYTRGGPPNSRAAQVLARGTNHPGATLLHLHSWLTRRSPAGRQPYLAHVQQPVAVRETQWGVRPFDKICDRAFYLCSNLSTDDSADRVASASRTALGFARHWARNGYQTIWVDLEAVHTLAGVVGAVIDQCRQFDAGLPPAVLPIDDHADAEAALSRAVELVTRALRRTRYLVVLDGLETYAWPPTTHHGVTHLYLPRAAARLANLCNFLQRLAEDADLGESRVCLTVDDPKSRHNNKELVEGLGLAERVEGLRALVGKGGQVSPATGPGAAYNSRLAAPQLHPTAWSGSGPLVSVSREHAPTLYDALTGASDQHAAASLVLFYLSCFRRTRTLVALDTLLRPVLKTRASIDGVLEAVLDQSSPWLRLTLLEGGGYWFDREVRDYIYENSTEYTSTTHMAKCFTPTAAPDDIRAAAFQLLLTACTHQQIARIYYTKVYVQSHDAAAFLEHVYHRLSSVRCLTKLIGLTRHLEASADDQMRAAVDGVARCGQLLKNASPADRSAEALDSTEFERAEGLIVRRLLDMGAAAASGRPDDIRPGFEWRDIVVMLRDELARRHRREIRSLHRTLVRADGTLRTRVPAEQLLNWCQLLLADDLEFRCNAVVVGYIPVRDQNNKVIGYDDPPQRVSFQADGTIVNTLATPAIESLRSFLQDLVAKCHIERSDYAACVRLRLQQLTGAGAIQTVEGEPSAEVLFEAATFAVCQNRCRPLHCHFLLDVVACFIKRAQEGTASNAPLDISLGPARALLLDVHHQLDSLEDVIGRSLPTDLSTIDQWLEEAGGREAVAAGYTPDELTRFASDVHEARLRWQHLSVECHLLRTSAFSHDGFDPARLGTAGARDADSESDGLARLSEAYQAADAGLSLTRGQHSRAGQPPRSVVIDPTTDDALYLQYRAVFHTLLGRVVWMRDGGDEGFEAAYRHFEFARGGALDGNPLLAALTELASVEACLARARILINSPTPSKSGDPEVPSEAARAKYETARGALQRARSHLLRSRRNVIWWKLFFQLVAQYHADRLLLGCVRLSSRFAREQRTGGDAAWTWPQAQFPREQFTVYAVRTRRAYESVRRTLDLHLPGAAEPARRSRWVGRVWSQITLSGYVVGRLALRHPNNPYAPGATPSSQPAGEDHAPQCVMHGLKQLNQSALLLTDKYIHNLFGALGHIIDHEKPLALVPGRVSARELWYEILALAARLESTSTPK